MKRGKKMSNRWMYTLITLGIILIVAGVIYATAPNPGHSSSEIDFTDGIEGVINFGPYGDVGIGVSDPDDIDAQLHVKGATSENLVLFENPSDGVTLRVTADSSDSTSIYSWSSGGTGVVAVSNTGNALEAYSYGSGYAGYFEGNVELTKHNLYFSAPDSGDIVFQTATGTEKGRVWFDNNYGLALRASPGGYSMLLDPNGNVGIGDITPDTKLDVQGNVGADAYCDQNGANCNTISQLTSGQISGVVFDSAYFSDCSSQHVKTCPTGTKLLTGGCAVDSYSTASLQYSYPYATNSGWYCKTTSGGCTIYVTCANY